MIKREFKSAPNPFAEINTDWFNWDGALYFSASKLLKEKTNLQDFKTKWRTQIEIVLRNFNLSLERAFVQKNEGWLLISPLFPVFMSYVDEEFFTMMIDKIIVMLGRGYVQSDSELANRMYDTFSESEVKNIYKNFNDKTTR